jgi:hypothetical protein
VGWREGVQIEKLKIEKREQNGKRGATLGRFANRP